MPQENIRVGATGAPETTKSDGDSAQGSQGLFEAAVRRQGGGKGADDDGVEMVFFGLKDSVACCQKQPKPVCPKTDIHPA
jgi:hypothetical protein